MRIGIFTDTYVPNINGVTTSIVTLKEELEKKGNIVYIVTCNDKNYKFIHSGRIIKLPAIKTGIYDYRLGQIYSIKASRIIKKWNLDVIHSQTEFSIGTFARIIAKRYKIPLVHTYHTLYEETTYYVNRGFFDRTSKKILKRLTLFYCDKTVDELIVPTLKIYKIFKNDYKLKRDIHIIETGIDDSKMKMNKNLDIGLERKKLNLSNDDFVLLYLGRIAREKNIHFLVSSMKEIVNKNNKIKLLIVGLGPEEVELKEYVKNNNLEKNVIFNGKVPWNMVYKFYRLSDLFVTSSHSETQGLTVLEALCCCLPVVCVNDDSFKNVVINKVNGMIFDNKKEYINIILELSRNEEKVKELVDNTVITRECFTSERFCCKVIEVYNKAIINYRKE